MSPEDIPIWERFLDKYHAHFAGFDYDVKVGTPVEMNPEWPPNIKAMAVALTKKRIDAIGYSPGRIWIFEVKPNAGTTALGQIITYRDLFIFEKSPIRETLGCIVTDRENRDARALAEKYGIRYEVV